MDKANYIKNEVRKRILSVFPGAQVVLYGSRARGDARSDSDWDFLAIVEPGDYNTKLSDTLRESIVDLSLETREDIMVFVQTSDHVWKFQLAPFYQNIKKEGIVL